MLYVFFFQVNNIHVKNRKMYILYDIEASEKVIIQLAKKNMFIMK